MTAKPHILVVEGRFYRDIADDLLEGAKRALDAQAITFDVITVPGALEIPQVLALAIQQEMFKRTTGKMHYTGCVALGCVIRGETSHYDIVANESARVLLAIATLNGVPLGNGILTVETHDQAKTRAAPSGKNKGGDAVQACLEVARVRERFFAQRVIQ